MKSLRWVIARNITVIRTEIKMSKTQFAKKAKLDPSVVTKLEVGTQNLTADTIELVAKVLGCSASRLLARSGNDDAVEPALELVDHALASARRTVEVLEAIKR